MLSPAQLLHDLYGSKALLQLAGARHLSEAEYLSLYRERMADVADVRWTEHDVAILDEAAQRGRRRVPAPSRDRRRSGEELRMDERIVREMTEKVGPARTAGKRQACPPMGQRRATVTSGGGSSERLTSR